MKKFLLLFIVMLTLFTSVAYADRYATFNAFEGVLGPNDNVITTNTPVNGVKAYGFVCADASCSSFSSQLYGGQPIISNTNQITVSYPTTLQSTHGYAHVFIDNAESKIIWVQRATFYGTDSTPVQGPNVYLTKKDVCQAEINSFSVINDVAPNEPLQLEVDASLDANIWAALQSTNIIGFEAPQIPGSYDIRTRTNLIIQDDQGNTIHQNDQLFNVDEGDAERVMFSWTPTELGFYNATIVTTVPDSKCVTDLPDQASQQFSVIGENSELCYALVENLNVLPLGQSEGEPTTISFESIANVYDEFGVLSSLPSQAVITVSKAGFSDSFTVNIPTGDVFDKQLIQETYTFPEAGVYNIDVRVTAQNCPYDENLFEATQISYTVDETPNNAPSIDVPDIFVNQDEGFLNNIVDLESFANDPDQSSSTLQYSITEQTNPSVVTCVSDSNNNLDCNILNHGQSTIKVQVEDDQGETGFDIVAITVDQTIFVCSSDEDCNDNNPYTQDICHYPASPSAYCENRPIEQPTCEEAIEQGILTGYIYDGNKGKVVNHGPWTYSVGLASYQKFDEVIQNQVIHDYRTTTLGEGEEVILEVNVPYCAYQIDLFCGEVIHDFGEEGFYEDRKIGWRHFGDENYCSITCESDSDCQATTENSYCENGNYKTGITSFTCRDSGTIFSYCEEEYTEETEYCEYACGEDGCYTPVTCSSNNDCNDYDEYTKDICRAPGTANSFCEHQDITCKYDSDCNDNNGNTQDVCINPGRTNSYCENTPFVCSSDNDCNDNNHNTDDECVYPNTAQSYCENSPVVCEDADYEIEVDLKVVGNGCHPDQSRITDSETIFIPQTGIYDVTAIVKRSGPDSSQPNEEFWLSANGITGPEVTDRPGDEIIRNQFAGQFSFTQGNNDVQIDSAAFCPPDTTANSVRVEKLCLKEVEVACHKSSDCGDVQTFNYCTSSGFKTETHTPTCVEAGTPYSYCDVDIQSYTDVCNNICDNSLGCDYTQCSDDIDNDGDNAIDFPNDIGCTDYYDDDEYNANIECYTNSDCDDTNTHTIDTCVNAGTPQSYCDYTGITCFTDSECDDNNSHTLDVCAYPGTIFSECIYSDIECFTDVECNDNNQNTEDVCIYPGTTSSECQNTPIVCLTDADCNDYNSYTEDVCHDAGTTNAYCGHTPYECLTDNDCDDNNAYTEDVCHNAGTTNAYCGHNPYVCLTDNDCDDNDAYTEDVCHNAGTTNAYCGHNPYVCLTDNDCDDNDAYTEDVCHNAGTTNAYCGHNPYVCLTDNDCDDNDSYTEDVCHNAGTTNAYCGHTPYQCLTDNDCDDNDAYTEDVCQNAGTTNAYCQHNPYVCLTDNDCDDNDSYTEDVCHNAGTTNAYCGHTPYQCLTDNDCDDNDSYTKDICQNAGTTNAYCRHLPIVCYTNSDCGTPNNLEYCSDNEHVQESYTPTCYNAGTENAYCETVTTFNADSCSNTCDDSLGCDYTQCSDGIDNDGDSTTDFPNDLGCTDYYDDDESDGHVTCTTNSDCGTVEESFYCSGLDYNHEVKTPVCYNAGSESSFCKVETTTVVDEACNNICDDDLACDYTQCSDGIDNDGDSTTDFPTDLGCTDYYDDDESDGHVECTTNSDCGTVEENFYCSGLDYNHEVKTPVCYNAGSESSFCKVETTTVVDEACNNICDDDLACDYTQCSDGIDNDGDSTTDFPNDLGCTDYYDDDESDGHVECTTNSDCGAVEENFYCSGLDYNHEVKTPVCYNAGAESSFCKVETTTVVDETCNNICDDDLACDYTQCSDGIDNDGDNDVDYPTDLGCTDYYDDDESDGYVMCNTNTDCGSVQTFQYCSEEKTHTTETHTPTCHENGTERSWCNVIITFENENCNYICDDSLACDYTQCTDNIDNDGDNTVDFPSDLGCTDVFDDDESDGFVACHTNLDCGTVEEDFYCTNLDYNHEVRTPVCNNAGTESSFCEIEVEVTVDQVCNNICDDSLACDYTQCSDGIDNDGDSWTDFPTDLGCSDYFDDDESDGFVECSSNADCGTDEQFVWCSDLTHVTQTNTFTCNNPGTEYSFCIATVDNQTQTCNSFCSPNGCDNTQCSDGIDNDGDGVTDMADPGCSDPSDDDESDGTTQCQDGIDNDGDGWVDMVDPGCDSPQDNDEKNQGTTQCSDGIDNDGDQLIDGNDPHCTTPEDDDESTPVSTWRPNAGLVPHSDGLIERMVVVDEPILIGSFATFTFDIRNRGETDLDHTRIQVSIPELGISRRAGPFPLNNGHYHVESVSLYIPYWVEPGEYMVRAVMYDEEVKRVQHRPITIQR